MKRTYLTYILVIFSLTCTAQQTVEVARLFVVNLYFEEPISDKVDLGDPLYYEISRDGNRLTITVNPELPPIERLTNLTVHAESGNVYTLLLKTVDKPGKFNIPIKVKDASLMFTENFGQPNEPKEEIVEAPKHYYSQKMVETFRDSVPKPSAEPETDELYEQDKTAHIKRKIFYHKSKTPDIHRYHGRNGKVFLRLYSVRYNKNELYLFLGLDNQEGIDFDINTLHIAIGTNKKRKNTYQKIGLEPLLIYDLPERVQGGKEHLFALVFEKFALDQNKSLYLDLDEKNGGRNIQLTIDHKTLSNPERF